MFFLTRKDQQSRVSIIDFPPELLLMIFKNVHDDLHDEIAMYRRRAPSDMPQWQERDYWFRFSTFPSAFASVSKVWSEVMAMEPTFWTNIVIFIDSDELSLTSIAFHLYYSRQLPIDVTVMKKTPDLLLASEAHENRRLQTITDIIRPHAHRCLSLRLKVTYTSSLPSISTYLQGTFPLLNDLRLEASQSSETIQTPVEIAWDIKCPSLLCLALDGLNFIDVFINAPHLLDQVQQKRLSKIAISHLRQYPNGLNRLSLGDIWPLISQTYTLHLEDLDLDCNEDTILEAPDSYESELTLVDLNRSITSAVLLCYEITAVVEITRCCLEDLYRIPYALSLRLENIDDVENLSRLLPEWDGNNLEIRSCPGFNDTVLRALASAREHIPGFSSLFIENCSNFSSTVLRYMIENRAAERVRMPRSIRGIMVPAINDQDKEWFSANHIRLSWNE